MAKKETRRNESLRLAILLLLLAISQAYAPPFLSAGAFGNSAPGGGHEPKIVLEAGKHGWRILRHGASGATVHDKIGRRDCLRWRLDLKAHCLTAIGLSDGDGASNAGDGETGSGSDGVFALGSGTFGDSGLGGLFIAGGSGAHGGGNRGGGSEGGGSGGGGNSGGGSGGGGGGAHGGGNSGGGANGGGSSGSGSGGGDGSHGGGSHDGGNSGGDPEDGGPAGCGPADPVACTPGGGGSPGCPDQTNCGPPLGGPAATTAVPEPSPLWLMAAGIVALLAERHRRKHSFRQHAGA